MKKHLIIILVFLCSCGPAWEANKGHAEALSDAVSSSESVATGNIKIIVFDVGEGDSAIVISPEGKAALIDTGLLGSKKGIPEGVDLEHLFISHSDDDHDGDAGSFDIEPEAYEAGDVFHLGASVDIRILAKDCEYADGETVDCDASDDNAHSAAMLVTYGGFRYLTAGDLPGGGGEPPYQTVDMETHIGELSGDVDVVHVGHHGSNTSSNQRFIELTGPKAAVISVGDSNDYWHPHSSTVERLLANGIAIYQTERGWLKDELLDDVNIFEGDITIESDGSSFDIY